MVVLSHSTPRVCRIIISWYVCVLGALHWFDLIYCAFLSASTLRQTNCAHSLRLSMQVLSFSWRPTVSLSTSTRTFLPIRKGPSRTLRLRRRIGHQVESFVLPMLFSALNTAPTIACQSTDSLGFGKSSSTPRETLRAPYP